MHDGEAGKKRYFDSNIIKHENARILRRSFTDYFEADVDRSTCLNATSSRREKLSTLALTTNFHTAAFPIRSMGKTLT